MAGNPQKKSTGIVHAAIGALAGDGKRTGIEQGRDGANSGLTQRRALDLGRQAQQEGRLQRSMHHKARVTLGLHRVFAIVVDAMGVERERGRAKEQRGGRLDGAPPMRHATSPRQWCLDARGRH